MLVLNHATIVTGDGATVIDDGTVAVDGEVIADVRSSAISAGPSDTVVDLGGALLMPGAVNPHSHGTTTGPLFGSAATPVSLEVALRNLDIQLSQGTTTTLCLDGFVLPAEAEVSQGRHPAHLIQATHHWPEYVAIARMVDGSALTAEHDAMSVESMLAAGAVAIGEVGGGIQLAGSGMNYRYIPDAIERETGHRPRPQDVERLREAILGRRADPDCYRRHQVGEILVEMRLNRLLSPERAREIIVNLVLPPVRPTLDSFVHATELAMRHEVPLCLHNSAVSEEATIAAAARAGELVVACHSNEGTFTAEEAVACARRLKANGAWVEASTLDSFGLRRLEKGPETIYALLSEGLVDFLGTDFAGGFWDGLYQAVDRMVGDRVIGLAPAVAMVTKNVTEAIPRLAPNRGELRAGNAADFVVSAPGRPGAVEAVYVDGRRAYGARWP